MNKFNILKLIWPLATFLGRIGRRSGILNIRIGKCDLGNRLYGLFVRLLPKSSEEYTAILPWTNMLIPLWHFAASDYITATYEKDTCDIFRRYVQKGMTVVDIGAHIGYFTFLSANLVGAEGHVYAFEPDSRYNIFLYKSIGINNFHNISVLEKAIYSKMDHRVLFSDPRGGGGRLSINMPGFVCKPVETITLDQFFSEINWPPVHLIKIDIEGGEEAALDGMKYLCTKNKSLMLILEVAPNSIRLAGANFENLVRLLLEYGFTQGIVIGKKEKKFCLPEGLIDIYEQMSSEEQINIFLIK